MTTACPACIAIPEAEALAASASAKVTLSVPDIHCAHCIQTIERGLKSLQGVHDARVNLTLRRVQIDTDLEADAVVGALAGIGYKSYPFDAALLEAQTDKTGRDLLLRLGVAGFAMMNVMLLSVAVWAGAEGATRDLFHLISGAIALPAALFAAKPFFTTAWSALRVGRLNMDAPISLAIILAAGMSLYESLNGGEHAYFDAALSLTFFLLIGRVLDHRSRAVARSAAKDLAAMEVQHALRKRGDSVETVPTAEIGVGDILLVPAGMRIPVDGTLLSGEALCDRSFLTGESDPVSHGTGAELKAGEVNLGRPLEMRADVVGEDTELRKIASLVETAENARGRYTSLADKAARAYAPAVHILAAITFLGWIIATGDLRLSINVSIAVLIITCPCALGLAVPAVSTAAIGKLFELGFLVKSGTALERLAEVDTLIFDKTGTLTRPGFDLASLDLSETEQQIAKALAQVSAHPLSKALVQHLDQVPAAPDVTDIREIAGNGVTGSLGGVELRLGHGAWVGSDTAGLALRIGGKVIDLPSQENIVPGAKAAQAALAAMGLDRQVLSGDGPGKTAKLARALAIPTWQAEVTPDQKHDYVAAIGRDHRACMFGDGINDAAALAAAHASIAPGSALDAARNAADVVMVKDTLGALPQLFAISRKAAHLSRQNFTIATLYNVVAIPIAMAGFATPLMAAISMSISSITVILNALRVRSAS